MMIEFLTKSKIRQRLILIFLYNQNRELYLSEISKLVKTSPGTTQRELNRLLNIDFIRLNKRGKQNYYKLNIQYPLLEEVESIVRKTFGIEAELRSRVGKLANVDFAFLFGSYVKGGFKSDSDIDLFIVGTPDQDELQRRISDAERLIQREINYHILDKREFLKSLRKRRFYQEIVKNPILLSGDRGEFEDLTRKAE